MRTLIGCAMVVVLAVAGGAGADEKDKIDGKKLVGTWEPNEAKGDAKHVIEFTKDGKLNIKAGAEVKYEGTYTLDGNKLSLTVKAGENEIKKMATILKLTDEVLEADGDDGKKSFKRIKEK